MGVFAPGTGKVGAPNNISDALRHAASAGETVRFLFMIISTT